MILLTVSTLLKLPCNKSDNINVVPNLLTTCDKQCEQNLLTDLLQDVIFSHLYK